jgi:hypothetical protein
MLDVDRIKIYKNKNNTSVRININYSLKSKEIDIIRERTEI